MCVTVVHVLEQSGGERKSAPHVKQKHIPPFLSRIGFWRLVQIHPYACDAHTFRLFCLFPFFSVPPSSFFLSTCQSCVACVSSPHHKSEVRHAEKVSQKEVCVRRCDENCGVCSQANKEQCTKVLGLAKVISCKVVQLTTCNFFP